MSEYNITDTIEIKSGKNDISDGRRQTIPLTQWCEKQCAVTDECLPVEFPNIPISELRKKAAQLLSSVINPGIGAHKIAGNGPHTVVSVLITKGANDIYVHPSARGYVKVFLRPGMKFIPDL